MSRRRSLAPAALSLAALPLLALAGCAQPFRADVARFQALPVPQGQTFTIQAADPAQRGGLEFSQYASIVAARLAQQGYQPAAAPGNAALVVTLAYGVDNGREKIVSTPGFGGFGYGGLGYGGFGPYGRGFGRFGGGFGYSPFYYGWNDPFFFGGGGADVRSYTVYQSQLDMKIERTADGQRLFEGRAKARSTTDNLTVIVPNLIEAMFTNFPGRSGEEVRISIPPPPRNG